MWSVSTSNRKKRTYHHGDLRRKLLDTATAMLERDGPDELSLRAAARRAGVSHNAPYRHFADRDALLAAIAADGFRALAQALHQASDSRAMGEAYIAFALARPRLFALMFGTSLKRANHPDLAAAMDEAFAPLAQSVGTTTSDDPRPRIIAAWAVVHGLAHLLIDDRLGPNLKTAAPDTPALVRAVLTAFGRGLAINEA
jgi:AcrR family transcriptional regulator